MVTLKKITTLLMLTFDRNNTGCFPQVGNPIICRRAMYQSGVLDQIGEYNNGYPSKLPGREIASENPLIGRIRT